MSSIRVLGLYDLLAPQFLAGFQFPDYIDKYLSLLAVADFQTTSDPDGILYTGTVFFPSSPGNPPVLQHRDPSGAVFDIHDLTMNFRLLAPRTGSNDVKTVIDAVAMIPTFQPIQQIVNDFGPQNSAPTDYPGIAFQLELLVGGLAFHLGDSWKPAVQAPDFHIIVDPNATTQDVKIVLPKVLLRYTQDQDFSKATSFKLASWGDPGFDAPNDLSEGELATMVPPLAIHKSGRVAFGIDEIIVDLSENSTPPEILDHFGADQGFEGVYIRALQVYYTDKDKDFAINVAIRDALISFAGEVSLEAELDVLIDKTPFEVEIRMYDGNKPVTVNEGNDDGNRVFTGGKAKAPPNVVIYVQITGGVGPYTTSVDYTPDGAALQHLWNDSQRNAQFNPQPTQNQHGTLVVNVTDSSSTPQSYRNTLEINVVVTGNAPAGTPAQTTRADAVFTPDSRPAGIPDDYTIGFTPSHTGTTEILSINGGPDLPAVTVAGTPYTLGEDRQVIVDLAAGASDNISVTWGASSLPASMRVLFHFDKPENTAIESTYTAATPADSEFNLNQPPDGTPNSAGHLGRDAITYFVQTDLDLTKPVNIVASASTEGHADKVQYDQELSARRGNVVSEIIQTVAGAPAPTVTPIGQTANPNSDPNDRAALITGTAKGATGYTLTGTLHRDPTPAPQTPPPATQPPAAPGPPANPKPPVIRRISLRLRLERSVPVLIEISGELDLSKKTADTLHSATGQSGSLDLQPTAAATKNPNPADGLVDFTLNVTYDPATADLTETLTLGAAPADVDGLLRMNNPSPHSTLKNIFGAVLIFTPILNAATTALDPQSAGDWTAIGIDLGVPALIGGLGIINTTDVTLFSGALQLRENVPSGAPAKFTNASLTFDYKVGFTIDIDLLDIHSSRPLSVRYKAVGVNLHFGDPVKFEFVLDTSKGYSLDLSDPGLFNLPGVLGDLLKIAGARIARFNPITLELDIEIKADLGIVTVDKFLVKVPLDGSSAPMILPSGVKVNIPATLVGSGAVNISEGGFEGTIDITLVPVKLRIAASVGVEHVSENGRDATAFYLGLEVDFPAPIILGSTGLGIFGLFGLFGMHYRMKEDPPIPGDAVGPDLRWLMNSDGAPYQLENPNTHVKLWEPKLDNWAFGIGVVLGTVDGFLLNLRGAFILTLPGPRIIITCNLKIVTPLPGLSGDGMDAANLDVGIIGILDIDVGAGQITLGVMINLAISSLIQIQIPIQLFFSWVQPQDWHLWIGTISTPASANILGIVRGGGYFMVGGQDIAPFPPGSTGKLPGTAVALGIFASIIWGSEDIGIYLKVAASADFGVSFSLDLFIVGHVHLEGELRLIIISISAYGDFLVKAPNPLYLNVHVCGSISFFFFSIDACVDFSIGNDSSPQPPPPLITKMYLQSFAPVIASGQGGDKPIDGTLGDGVMVTASGLPGLNPAPGTEVTVPIDTVPVLQMQFAADSSTLASTFTSAIGQCVTYPGNPGVNLGGGRFAHYKLKSLDINPPLPGGVQPPAAWRPNKPSGDTSQTAVDLALFSRNPNVTNSAVERSTEFTNSQLSIWADACRTIAPPSCVLWAFCGQRLGPSPSGWQLFGIPIPDPPDTVRTSPVPTEMQVEQPRLSAEDPLLVKLGLPLDGKGLAPAQVIGFNSPLTAVAVNRLTCEKGVELPELLAVPFRTGIEKEIRDSSAIKRLASLTADNRWLRFHTGASNRTRILLAADQQIAKRALTTAEQNWILIRERDQKNSLIKETPLNALGPKIVGSLADLPSTWTNTGGPWYVETVSVASLFNVLKLTMLFVEFKPDPKTVTIEVAYTGTVFPRPSVVVGLIEACPRSETDRYQNGVVIQTSTIKQIQSYLDGGTPVPLLDPGTEYTITANYDITVQEQDGSTNDFNNITQGYRFKTGTDAPAKLDPWVLATSPDQTERFVFYDDPNYRINVLFNDRSIIQLFKKLGYDLAMDLRAADGLPEPMGSPVTTVSIDGVGTAAYDTLQQLVAQGELPCVGAASQYQNQLFTSPVPLRPLMGYTLDLRTNPPLPAPPPNTPVTPLFRRSFTTSKYPGMQALAKDLAATLITHRPLKTKLSFNPSGHQVMPDQDIQDAFMMAGEQALPAPEANAIVMYWAPAVPNGPAVPCAILIDSTEPLWRTRKEPSFTNPIPSDPSFKIVTVDSKPAMEVTEQGGPSLSGYITSPGGTRTVAVFKPGFAPPAAGTEVQVALHRFASANYNTPDEVRPFINITVMPSAPWENDHV